MKRKFSMKKICLILLFVCAFLNAFDIKTELEYKSKRISKGKVSNPDSVGLINVKVNSGYGFYYTLFGIDDLTDYNKKKGIDRYEFERFEHTFGFEWKFKDVDCIKSLKLNIGYLFTDYQENMGKNTDPEHEAFIKITTGLPLNPGIKVNYDVEHDYLYWNPYVSYDFHILENLILKQDLNLYFYNSTQCKNEFKVDHGMFTCLYYKAFLKFEIMENLSCGPLFEAAWALDHRVRDAYAESDKNNRFNCLAGFKIDFTF